ncbi:F0F1 ATP synthase subunit gamma [Rhabdobacter roseus]|uniref:F-type H+-transporting ATPase subunit gamma n=1 Tax=Rhabdobacter roseus TaxID=1655419 RepID=A0A840TXT6_9BACT|nr:F0F1 ATP synthase subunit gamma [Rhabdobacter roseus]MBB5285008.1 F-type H+-transporting ATPase subunit gamma [Rhabdobacter roseus]
METLQAIARKIDGAQDLGSVVRTMKTMAAANIEQYEAALTSLHDYHQTVALGLAAYFRHEGLRTLPPSPPASAQKTVGVLALGSDQGLVGQFNDLLADYLTDHLSTLPGEKIVWVVGERLYGHLEGGTYHPARLYTAPYSVAAVTQLVGQVLQQLEESQRQEGITDFYLFHHQPVAQGGYLPTGQLLLPLDKNWYQQLLHTPWPTPCVPHVQGPSTPTLQALIREYLFVSLFKACTESLASENTSRLMAMQRAEKNIEEILQELTQRYHRFRQSTIDAELFDVVSGFELLGKD